MNKCFITRNNDQWATPTNIYNHIINELRYIDFNPLKKEYEDSLKKEFNCNLYCNPPFSNIEPFVNYMFNHFNKGYDIIMLLPVRSGTKWFKNILESDNTIIYFFTQRLHFNDSKSAPFDCMLVHFTHYINIFDKKFIFINRNLEEE